MIVNVLFVLTVVIVPQILKPNVEGFEEFPQS